MCHHTDGSTWWHDQQTATVKHAPLIATVQRRLDPLEFSQLTGVAICVAPPHAPDHHRLNLVGLLVTIASGKQAFVGSRRDTLTRTLRATRRSGIPLSRPMRQRPSPSDVCWPTHLDKTDRRSQNGSRRISSEQHRDLDRAVERDQWPGHRFELDIRKLDIALAVNVTVGILSARSFREQYERVFLTEQRS